MGGDERTEMAITILDYVVEKLGDDYPEDGCIDAGQFYALGFDIMGGCEVCGATLGAYNAYPTRSGYWRCAEDLGETGYGSVAEFDEDDA